MSQKNPIKFLDSYSKDDKDIFFGRDKETTDLYEKISKSQVVLLYGLSGTGKTSLVQCGLENRYEADQILFIYIRRGNDIIKSFKQAITAEASSLIHPLATPSAAIETLYFDYLKPIIIVFDQFEELFISGSLVERQNFISAIAEILNSNLKVKFIFSLREEYLAHMDEFEEEVPNIYDLRQRLEKMRRSTLEEVITKIAEKGGTELENNKVPGLIIDNISDRKGHVELPYLQVYLDKLTRLMNKSDGKNVLTINFLEQAGELKDVLGDFLEEQIAIISSEVASKEAINHLLKQFITHDGTKKQITFSEVKPYGNITPEQVKVILTKLEESRIIKLEDGVYELSHDSLARKIAEKRTTEEIQLIEVAKFIRNAYNSYRQTETLLDSKQLKYVEPFVEKLDITEEEHQLLNASKRKVRKIKILIWSAALAGIIILLAAGYYWQYTRFIQLKTTADKQLEASKYAEAKTNYLRALDIYVPNKKGVPDSLAKCLEYLRLEPEFQRLIKEGDRFFSMGIIEYDSAFEQYESAKELIPNSEEINRIIFDKKADAITKYTELAKVENEEGHLDIALSHLAMAFALDKDNSNTVVLFQKFISASSIDSLKEEIENIINYNPQVIPALLELLNKSKENNNDVGKYNVIIKSLTK